MNNSVILQVDESTKGLMEEIQSGISASIEDGIKDVRDKVASVDDNTDMILRKFKSFDGLSSTIDQLRSLADESKKFAAMVSPLQTGITEIQLDSKAKGQILSEQTTNLSSLNDMVVELREKQRSISSAIIEGLDTLHKELSCKEEATIQQLNDIATKLAQIEDSNQEFEKSTLCEFDSLKSLVEETIKSINVAKDMLEGRISNLSSDFQQFVGEFESKESAHREFEEKANMQFQSINETLEKTQVTLDIIVNLVTPFWKKWTK